MDIIEFCIEIIKREGKKFNVDVSHFNANQMTAATASDVNYDMVQNRCTYMYRYGAVNILFAQECYYKFMTEYKDLLKLFPKWKDNPNPTLCSISKGPALDCIALLVCCYLYEMPLPFFKTINIISKYGAWRNTINIIHQIISEGQLHSLPPSAVGNIEVVQGDPFFDFSTKVKERIRSSDVVMMSKCLNLQTEYNGKEKISASLMELFHAMKYDALLFCIDTKPAIALITSQIAKFPGEFLLEPVHMNKIMSVETAEFYKNIFGCPLVLSARGTFFVWKKSFTVFSNQILGCKLTDTAKRSCSVNCINESSNITSPNLSNSNLRLSNSLDCLASSNLVKNHNTPNLFTENLAATLVNSECSVQYSPSKIKKVSQTVSPSLTMRDELKIYDSIKKEEINSKITTGENYSPTCNLVSRPVQTELDGMTERDRARIVSLTERVVNLTASINVLLQINKQKNNIKEDPENIKEEICDHVIQHDAHNHCSIGHSSLCHGHSPCLSNFYSECCQKQCLKKLCHTRMSHTNHMVCNQNHPINSCGTHLNFSAENMPSATPNLVIPLNSISSDVLMQIISLISQTNKKI